MASLNTLGFTTKLELSSVSQSLFNLNMFLVFGSLTNWDGLWWSPIVILRWGRLFGFWPRPCWPREQQWQVINHHQHYHRHHHREYEDTKIIVCLTKVKSQSTESRILKQLFTFEASLHRDGWALRGWCRPTLNCHAGGRGCGGQSWFFMMTTMIIMKHFFFPGETHIRSTFPGWAQYGRDDRAQMRHQVGQLYVFFNIIITKMRSDFALLPSMKIFFHRNPELFHGFVLNGPLIVPGFQVVCLKEERCIKW